MTPVRMIDADSIEVLGDGGGTNMTEAMELAHEGLRRYMQETIERHPQRAQHPLPLLLLFSDGHNTHGDPLPAAEKIKQLQIDGDPIVIACAGVSTDDSDQPDEQLLRAIASPECYVHIDQVRTLSSFLAEVGSSGASTPREVAQVIRRLEHLRQIEE